MSEYEKSGLIDNPAYIAICKDFRHKPPTHIYIPPDKLYKHVCPACGAVQIMAPPMTAMLSGNSQPSSDCDAMRHYRDEQFQLTGVRG